MIHPFKSIASAVIIAGSLNGGVLAATLVPGDTQINGNVGAGTETPPVARLDVKISSGDLYALIISSQNGDPLLVIDNKGNMGVGLSNPQAALDIRGAEGISLQLRIGNSSSSYGSSQIVFSYHSTASYSHSIKTRADESQNQGNGIDFLLWRSTGYPADPGDLRILSLGALSSSTGTCSVHVRPVGEAAFELEVSSGAGVTGGGAMLRQTAEAHSSRRIKADVFYLGQDRAVQACADIKSLKHARFRYKSMALDSTKQRKGYMDDPSHPSIRGLIFEDAPASIRGPEKTVVVDNRVLNLELTFQEMNRRIQELQVQIAAIEKDRKKNKRRR